MMPMTKKRANRLYIMIQFLFFIAMAGVACFATPYLIAQGYSSGQIGLTIGIANAGALLAQQLITTVIRKTGMLLGNFLVILFSVMAMLSLLLIVCKPSGILLPILFGGVLLCENAAAPSINALYRGYHNRGTEINFAVARGVGSAAFSISSYLTGQLISRFTESIIPAVIAVPLLFLIVALLRFHAPNVNLSPERKDAGKASLLREYPHFVLFLFGATMLCTSQTFINTFLLQIVQCIGGDSSTVGVAMAISAITELPAMLLYRSLIKKIGNRRLLMISGWMWSARCALTMFSGSVSVVYLAQLLQFAGYAMYVPATSKHIAHALPESMYLRGEALVGGAYTAGTLIASILGGQLLDHLPVNVVFIVIHLISVVGAVCMTVSILKSLKLIPHIDK